MNSPFLVYLLVGSAAAAIGWVLWQSIVDAGEASSEKLEWGNGMREDGRQKPAIERFVSPGKLLRTRIFAAAMPSIVIPSLFVVAGFSNPIFLAVLAMVFASVGWRIPLFYYNRAVKNRQLKFEDSILDFTMGISSALKSGMAFPQAVERISARMKGPIREELEQVLSEYRLGTELATAFERMTERMPCEDIRLLATAIRLTTKTGGSLAEVLGEMTETIRNRREFQDKLKTLTAQGRFEGIGLGLMPLVAFIIFYFIQPEMTMSIFQSMAGWCALGVAVLLEVIGFVVINKICNVEV